MDQEAAIPEKNPAMERPEAQAAALVTRATTAFAAWKTLSLKERKARIGHLGRAIHHRRDDFSTLLREEVGKLEVEAYLADLLGLVDIVKYWTARIEAWLAPEPITFNPLNFPGKKALVTREPLGVLALITPWNYPLALTVRNLVPALLCGNCIIHKPSEHAPRVASLLQELCTEHLPEGVMQTLLGGPEAGRALVAAEVQGVSFIGSQAVGRSLAAALGPRLVPVSLELGGKDAALVLRDAPLERTVAGLVWGAFHNAGQDCSSIERAYLPAARREEFLTALREAVQRLDRTQVAPLINADAYRKVTGQLDSALAAGAVLVAGNERDERAHYLSPTVLEEVPTDQPVLQEETFGPVLPLIFYDDLETAITSVNATSYGLSNSIWTSDPDAAALLAPRLQCGMVAINNHSFHGAVPACPWVGRKGSGTGVTNSHHCLDFFTRPRLLVIDRSKKTELWWYPYNKALHDLVKALGLTLCGNPLKVFWGYLGLARILPRRFS